MDTELARTFLTIIETGSFVEAAERLHITQSTVSARIHRLEEQLGATLFDRRPDGCQATSAGRQFQRHAAVLTRVVQQARQEVASAGGHAAMLTVGGRIGLWEEMLSRWLAGFATSHPGIAINALVGFEADLMPALIEGRADIGVMYVPQVRPGLRIEPLLEEKLVLVSTHAPPCGPGRPGYVYVDWGPEFFAWHARAYPQAGGAAASFNVGPLGLEHVLARGGSGYFPLRLLQEPLRTGRLYLVPGTRDFRLPAYLCFAADARSDALDAALDTIRGCARGIGKFD